MEITRFGDRTIVKDNDLPCEKIAESQTFQKVQIRNRKESEVDLNDKKNIQFREFLTLLRKFKTNLESFRRNKFTSLSNSDNFFDLRKTEITITDGSKNANSYASFIVSGGATIGRHTLQITNIATFSKTTISGFTTISESVVSDPGTPTTFAVGTFAVDGANAETISLVPTDNLNNVASKINSVSKSTEVVASVQKISDSDYDLVLTSKNSGLANSHTLQAGAPDNALSSLGGSINNVAGVDASITFDGSVISRPSNQITDILLGEQSKNLLTINLIQATDIGDTINIDISNDIDNIFQKISELMTSYYDIRSFIFEQKEYVANSPKSLNRKIEGSIASEKSFLRLDTLIPNILGSSVDGIPSTDIATLTAVGFNFVKFDADGEIKPAINAIDYTDPAGDLFRTNLLTKFDQVRRVFEFDYYSSSPNIANIMRRKVFNKTFTISFDYDPARTTTIVSGQTVQDKMRMTVNSVTYNPDFREFSSSTARIRGLPDTPLDGLEIAYSTNAAETGTITFTQGIADKLFLIIEDSIRDNTKSKPEPKYSDGKIVYDEDNNVVWIEDEALGIVENDISKINKKNIRINDDIFKLNTTIAEIEERELDKCSKERGINEKLKNIGRQTEMNTRALFADKG